MRKVSQIIALVIFAFVINHATLDAQVRVRDNSAEQTKPKNNFASHLWYGGNIGLGFSSNSFQSLFQIGLSPMVGYKLFDQFSVGPRVSFFYSHYRYNFGGGDVQTANPITWTAGAFARYKLFRTIFAHAEYEFENSPVFTIGGSGDLEVLREQRTNTYLGAGYNSGERFGYEIMVLYNLSLPENSVESPFDIRFGFTYNF
ncbi:MAG: hypothetical protein ACK4TA_13845 [Saprospiraceae bacterium]